LQKSESFIKNLVDFLVFLSFFVTKNFRGTCSSVEMLKGYMVKESLGTPALEPHLISSEADHMFAKIRHNSCENEPYGNPQLV